MVGDNKISSYKWLRDDSSLTYQNWVRWQPAAKWERCVWWRPADGKWIDEHCGKKAGAFCEFDVGIQNFAS